MKIYTEKTKVIVWSKANNIRTRKKLRDGKIIEQVDHSK
jgi:hypothetical protein